MLHCWYGRILLKYCDKNHEIYIECLNLRVKNIRGLHAKLCTKDSIFSYVLILCK